MRRSTIILCALVTLAIGVLLRVEREAVADRSEQEIVDLPLPTMSPGVVTPSEPQSITIRSRIADSSLSNPGIQYLDERGRWKHFGHLRDDGRDGDDVALDRVFTLVRRVERDSVGALLLRAHAKARPQRDHIVHVSPPAELSVWPRMSINGVSFNHPPELVTKTVEGIVVLRRPTADPENEEPSLDIFFDPNPEGLSALEFYDGDPGRDLIGQSFGEVAEEMIAGRVAYRFVPVITFAGEVIVVVPLSDGRILRIVDFGSTFQDDVFPLLLDSLRL